MDIGSPDAANKVWKPLSSSSAIKNGTSGYTVTNVPPATHSISIENQ
jgi:hypothetical protein